MTDRRAEIAELLRVAEAIASEPYADPQAAVIHIIKALKLMNEETSDE